MNANLAVAAICLLIATSTVAQEAQPPTSVPTAQAATQPTTQPTSRPTTSQAVQEQKREAEIKEELADETARQAESKLEEIREEQEQAEREAERAVFPRAAQAKLERLEFEEAYEERRKELSALRLRYAQELRHAAEEKEAAEARQHEAEATLAALDQLTPEQRTQKAEELESAARGPQQRADDLRSTADAERAKVSQYQKLQSELAEQLGELETELAAEQRDEQMAQLRRALAQAEQLIDNQRLVAYAIQDQAGAVRAISDEYRREAEALRAANRRFWVEHAYILNIARILAVTIGVVLGMNLLAWLVANVFSTVARRLRREAATAGIKRAQTLIYFVRSIAKLLVWVFALVTILTEFGISPGQSAGALGVIGLVLAGMFQQLVIDFVKGIDIAAGGHYFIGDFIEVAGSSGHVLAIQVKYTVLRTPSGQVLNIPNSKCIPSRRFPSGYVDNYVDTPVPADANVEQAKAVLCDVGRLLNERVEAVKQRPEFVSTSRDGSTIYIRTLVRVLPTCDWVLKDHYIPMVKRRLEAENIPLAGEPSFFHMNKVATFRRLFSRELSESDIARVAEEEAQPTTLRPDLPDPDAPPPPDAELEPRGPVEASETQNADASRTGPH
ncbi:MAG TPA: mechanosensitive ion channel domain-containing protein [Phycisphaerae bacterium]|nr:mechanosensitive ion channel domain-containing protein [Phycisphaerae bacterium]